MDVEHLGQPCRARNVLAGRVVTDRSSGREMLVLANMNDESGAELIFVDFERDTARVFSAPVGECSWALSEVAGDRLVMGTCCDGKFAVFDLNQMRFTKTLDFEGETYIWNLAIGSDGRVYGGTYPGGKLGALDLDTYTLEDCGAPAPPNLYLRHVCATPERIILCSFICEKPTSLLYDPQAKRFEPVPEWIEGVTEGVSWNGYFLAGSRAYEGRSLDLVHPLPYPAPPQKGEWQVDTYVTTDKMLVLRQGNAVYRYGKRDKSLTLVADVDLRGGRLLASTRSGSLLGVRGQDYFIIGEGDARLDLKPIPGESRPRRIFFLKADDRNRLWGGPTFGQTLFRTDPCTGETVNTPTICDSGGEVYDVTFRDAKVYAAAYSGGDIVRYDPDQPWDQWNRENPKTLVSLRAKGYIRPKAGILLGADGKLYSGWVAGYGTYGGAVAITDSVTGDTELIENPLGQQAIEALAADDHFLYVGTSLYGCGLPPKPDPAVNFGVIECATKKVVFQHAFEGATRVDSAAYDARTKLVAISVDDKLHLFDARVRRFVTQRVPDTPAVTSRSMVTKDGKLFYGSDKAVVQVDLESGASKQVAVARGGVKEITVGRDGTLYFSCDADLYAAHRA